MRCVSGCASGSLTGIQSAAARAASFSAVVGVKVGAWGAEVDIVRQLWGRCIPFRHAACDHRWALCEEGDLR